MYYHNIEKDSMLNGDGLRVVLFVSGCELNCPNCQNPQTHNPFSGVLFDEEAEEELFSKLSQDYISGVTFSGGHPLESYNYGEVLRLCKKFREIFGNSKTIWVYTGYPWDKVKDLEIMKYIDVLCDGPYIDSLNDFNKKWVGSTNQRVIDVPRSLKLNDVILYCD